MASHEAQIKNTLQAIQITLDVLSHFSNISRSNVNKHHFMNLQYTTKYILEHGQQLKSELESIQNFKAPGSPLQSTIIGMGPLKAKDAIDIIRDHYT